MRVAYVVPYLRLQGGYATAARGAIRALSSKVDPVLVVAREDAREAKTLFPELPLVLVPEVQPLHTEALSLLPRLISTRMLIASLPPLRTDIVHALEAFPAGWVGRWLAEREGLPLVLTAHGTYAVVWRNAAWSRRAYQGVLRSASAICPISNGTADRMKAHFHEAAAGKILEVVLQGSEAAGVATQAEATEHRFPATPIVLSVGNLKERKGYQISLQAFALLQEAFPEARYRIVGSGLGSAYHKRLLGIASRLGLRNLEFLGAVESRDLDRLYAGSSIFLLASQEQNDHFEGFGLVFLEAGAHGLPVVGTRTGGIPDAVKDTETGLLFDPQDVSGMGEGLIRLSRDRELARELGRRGRRYAETLTWKRYAEQQFSVYTRVLVRSNS